MQQGTGHCVAGQVVLSLLCKADAHFGERHDYRWGSEPIGGRAVWRGQTRRNRARRLSPVRTQAVALQLQLLKLPARLIDLTRNPCCSVAAALLLDVLVNMWWQI